MIQGLHRTILASFTALMLAVLSVVSAHHMGPDRDEAARMEAFIAMGDLASDLCGLETGNSQHHCPFCHKLPKADRATAPDLTRRVLPILVQATGHDLIAGPDRILAPVGVRAPPFFT